MPFRQVQDERYGPAKVLSRSKLQSGKQMCLIVSEAVSTEALEEVWNN